MTDWGKNGWAVQPGDGEMVDLGGPHTPEILVRGEEVNDAMGVFLFHHDVIPANVPHSHDTFMKVMYVLEGEYQFRVGSAEFAGGPGTTVVVPRGTYHSFVTPTGGKVLFTCSPSGNEEMFRELGRLGPNPSAEQVAQVHERFAMTELPGDENRPWRP